VAGIVPEEARYLAACDPATDPETLAALARDVCQDTRQAVARNPNTPTNTLISMIKEFPWEIAQSPALHLICLQGHVLDYDHLRDLMNCDGPECLLFSLNQLPNSRLAYIAIAVESPRWLMILCDLASGEQMVHNLFCNIRMSWEGRDRLLPKVSAYSITQVLDMCGEKVPEWFLQRLIVSSFPRIRKIARRRIRNDYFGA
jgi:hypothetical protein